jgi:hypothetical protein
LLVEAALEGAAEVTEDVLVAAEAELRRTITGFKGCEICELGETAEMSMIFPPAQRLRALYVYRRTHRKL